MALADTAALHSIAWRHPERAGRSRQTASTAASSSRLRFVPHSGDSCIAHALDAYLVSPSGLQTKLAVTPVEGTGATEGAALEDACSAFAAWVSEQPLK